MGRFSGRRISTMILTHRPAIHRPFRRRSRLQGKPKKPIFTIPAWYSTSPKLYSEANSVRTGVKPPAGCNVDGNSPSVNEVIHKTSRSIRSSATRSRASATRSQSPVRSCASSSPTRSTTLRLECRYGEPVVPYPSKDKKRISQVVTSETLATVVTPASGPQTRRVARRRPDGRDPRLRVRSPPRAF